MSSSKNNIHNNLRFVKLKAFINQHFEVVDYSFTINKKDYIESISDAKISYAVTANNRIMDCNLRVLDSYLPEYLAFIIQNTKRQTILKQAIIDVISIGLPYIQPDYQQLFLERRFFNLLEAILFANFSNHVWRGITRHNLCYVTKHNNKLEYYSIYNRQELIEMLINTMIISSTYTNINTFRMNLSLK